MKIIFRALLVAGVLGDVLLVCVALGGGLSGVWLACPLSLTLAALGVLYGGMVADRRRLGSWALSLSETAERFGVPRKALSLQVAEVQSLWSVIGICRGSLSTIEGEVHSGYTGLRSVVDCIVGLGVVEIVVVHLAVPSDLWRLILFVVSVYANILLLGFYFSVKMNPHIVAAHGVVVRNGTRFVCEIPWANLVRVYPARPGSGGDLVINEHGVARVPVLSEVNVRIDIDPPVAAQDVHKGVSDLSAIELYCDDGQAFIDAVNTKRS